MRPGGRLTAVAVVLGVAGAPLLLAPGNTYPVEVLTRALVYGVLVMSVELSWGFTGIFTLGQALFFGIGAYTVGLLSTRWGITSLGLLLLLAAVAGLIAAFAAGLFLFTGRKVSDLYVALATLALAYVAERLAAGWDLVGAANGIPGIALPTISGEPLEPGWPLYLVALTLCVAAVCATLAVVHSQFGLAMKAVRDDEERAEFLGYRRSRIQILVFTGSGAMAASAGGMFALTDGFVSPSLLGVSLSTSVLLWVVLGGRGTVFGPLLGLFLIEVAGRAAADAYPTQWPVIIGVLLLLFIMFRPNGLWQLGGELRTVWRAYAPHALMTPEDPHAPEVPHAR